MDKYLIINADDFGMNHSSNMAVMDLFEKGGYYAAEELIHRKRIFCLGVLCRKDTSDCVERQ